LTELLASAVQLAVFADLEALSQAVCPVTVQELWSAGVGVTVTVPEAPAAAGLAEEALSDTEPVAPAWFSVKDLSPMVRAADRAVTELFDCAVQLTVEPDMETESQAGLPVTVQEV